LTLRAHEVEGGRGRAGISRSARRTDEYEHIVRLMLHAPIFEGRSQTQLGLILNLEQKPRLLAPMYGLAAL
jgi:hypothetical protein